MQLKRTQNMLHSTYAPLNPFQRDQQASSGYWEGTCYIQGGHVVIFITYISKHKEGCSIAQASPPLSHFLVLTHLAV